MSGINDCCSPCPDVQTVNVPGVQGEPGADGADGVNGVNAFTTVAAPFNVPALVGGTVTISVGNSTWMVVGQNIFIEGPANFEVVSIPGPSSVQLEWLDYPSDVDGGSPIAAGEGVSPGGLQGPLAGALPNVISPENSGGTASDTIVTGVGEYTIAFAIQLASLTTSAADLITDYVIGHRFKILSVAFVTTTLGTGAGASQTINLEINTTNVTGGVLGITLANTTPLGNRVDGTPVTANDTGTATDTLSIEVAAGGTVFTGSSAGTILISIKNMDVADAFATLADHVNDLINAL